MLSLIGDGFRAEVEGDRRALTTRDRLGLVYRAQDAGLDRRR
ncbi:MAG: hypothetical protein ACQEUI_12175 [Actinomycetota bacterium]